MSSPDHAEIVRGATLAFASDYFSFVGKDSTGRVAFALDDNRRRTVPACTLAGVLAR